MTTSTPATERTNPLHRIAGAALGALDRVRDVPGWSMTRTEAAEALVELAEVEARFREIRLRILATVERQGTAEEDGSTSTAAWLARRTRESRVSVNAMLRAAVLLDREAFAPTREAFAAGLLHEEQVWVILRGIEDLPADEVSDEERLLAQKHLIELAADHDAKQLRVAARKLFEVLAPDETDKREGEALEREERRARERCRFAMRDNGDGTTSGWFKLPTLQAEMLGKAVHAFAAPRRSDPAAWRDDEGRKVPYPRLLGQAFAELIEHLPADGLPQAGGVAATVVVTLDLEALRTGVGAAVLDSGHRVSAGELRRLACNAGVIPAVLGGRSEPLDLGRRSRLHTGHQRIAMAVRDRGCTAEGCDRPPAWCEAHHEHAWSEGGGTSVEDGRLLCPRHHQLAHDTDFEMRHLPGGKVAFHRRR